MDLFNLLNGSTEPINIKEAETSYFSKPSESLDPGLFRNDKMIPAVRNGIMAILFGHLARKYSSPESWSAVWLAGSGVSYIWSAHRDPADLDCLVGIDYVVFRQANPKFIGLSNQEIASMLNEGFREELQPTTENYLGTYELTFYVNVASDITSIKPYAAYSLTNDDWTVTPSSEEHQFPENWFTSADKDLRMAHDIVTRYQKSLNDISEAKNEVVAANARAALLLSLKQGSALFEDIHGSRKEAFGPYGAGYADYTNFRWQRGKSTGAVQALKSLKETEKLIQKKTAQSLYGVDLPDANTLIRRAASQYRG